MSTKILIADGDDQVVAQLESSLSFNGNVLLKAKSGKEAIDLTFRESPDLVILEVFLPEIDGFSVCRTLRAEGYKNPIIFLTNKTSEIDAVIGLELGAQDYIRKPVPIKELMARVELHLKKNNNSYANKVSVGDLEIDLERRKVKHRGQVKDLTHKEFQLLYALAQCPNKVFSRNELLNDVWGWAQYGHTRTVDIHMGYLRKKFEENPRRPRLFQTIRGIGYTLCTE